MGFLYFYFLRKGPLSIPPSAAYITTAGYLYLFSSSHSINAIFSRLLSRIFFLTAVSISSYFSLVFAVGLFVYLAIVPRMPIGLLYRKQWANEFCPFFFNVYVYHCLSYRGAADFLPYTALFLLQYDVIFVHPVDDIIFVFPLTFYCVLYFVMAFPRFASSQWWYVIPYIPLTSSFPFSLSLLFCLSFFLMQFRRFLLSDIFFLFVLFSIVFGVAHSSSDVPLYL